MAKIYVALIRKGLKTLTMYPNSSERKSRSCWRNNHAMAHFSMAQQEGGEKHGCYLCGTHCQG